MRQLLVALILSIGFTACGDDEPECFDIKEKEVGYGSPRGLLKVNGYLRFDVDKLIEIKAPVRIEASDYCMTGITTINSYQPPGFLSIDCQDVIDEDELSEIRRLTGVVGRFSSPTDENLLSPIEITDGSNAMVECFYNVE